VHHQAETRTTRSFSSPWTKLLNLKRNIRFLERFVAVVVVVVVVVVELFCCCYCCCVVAVVVVIVVVVCCCCWHCLLFLFCFIDFVVVVVGVSRLSLLFQI